MSEEPTDPDIGDPLLTAMATFIKEINESVDSGHALVSVAMVETWVTRVLLYKMRKLSNNVRVRIFEGYGPLSELAAKIDIAYAFELIDDGLLADLRVLKDIRNTFAHTSEKLSFDSPEIDVYCRKLRQWKKERENREVFRLTAVQCIEVMHEMVQKIYPTSALALREKS